MNKPSVGRGPADHYGMTGQRIVEISDNNGDGLGALLSVSYVPKEEPSPGLYLHLYRLDEGVTVTVEGHVVTPVAPRLNAEDAYDEALAEHARRMTGYCSRCGEYIEYDAREGLVHRYRDCEVWPFCPDNDGGFLKERHTLGHDVTPKKGTRAQPVMPSKVSMVARGDVIGDITVKGELAYVLGGPDPDEALIVVEGSRAELRAWVEHLALHLAD